MAEGLDGATLKIKVSPQIDPEEFNKLVSEIRAALKKDPATGPASTQNDDAPGPEGSNASQTTDTFGNTPKKSIFQRMSEYLFGEKNKSVKSKDKDEEETKADKDRMKTLQKIGKTVQTGTNLMFTGIKGIWGIVENLFQRVKKSSEFLQTVESLFNLAMTLLLMPLGNALAETILPATIQLVDDVTSMWDKFDTFAGNDSLTKIMEYVMDTGLDQIGKYLNNVGDTLAEQGGLIGAIGGVINYIGKWIQAGRLESLLSGLFRIISLVADHFIEFISLYVAMQTAQIAATLVASLSPEAKAMGQGVMAVAAAAGFGVTEAVMRTGGISSYAEGGYIPATNGGRLIHVAEAGEGEYVIPESKMNSLGSGTYNFYFNGYDMDQVSDKVKEILRDEVRSSNYKSGY